MLLIIPPLDPAILIEGRYAIEEQAVRTSHAATSFSITFEGTEVSILLKSPGNVFSVFVDEKEMPPLDLSENNAEKHLIAKNLKNGEHKITVAKRTESSQGDDIFKGFEIVGANPRGRPFPHDKPKKLKIEFLGNSVTAGYGVLDSVKENGYRPITESVFKSYAGVAAKALNAEMRTVAFSGRGIYRNNQEADTRPLPEFFPYIGVNNKIPWDFSWQPDIAVIELGANDFALGKPDSAKFVNATVKFAQQVSEKYPKAKIVIIEGPMLNDFYPEGVPSLTLCRKYLDTAKEELAKLGLTAYRFSLSPQDGSLGYGADWHPSERQSAKNGKEFADFITQLLNSR